MRQCYRLLAVDVDGTMMVGRSVSDGVADSLRECVRRGISVVPATGKKLSSIETMCNEVGIRNEVITCNGAMVFDFPTRELLSASFLPADAARKLLSVVLDDARVSAVVFTESDIISTGRNSASVELDRIGERTTRRVRSLRHLPSTAPIAKVLIAVEDGQSLRCVHRDYAEEFSDECAVTITSSIFIEFTAPNVSKGNALRRIEAARGITRERVVCVGDNQNDLSMFRASGTCIAVANGTEAIRNAADAIVPPADKDGLAVAIHQLVLSHG